MTCDVNSADCEFGVISYALIATRGFAYWVGTSFATPLVSGLAADVIEVQGAPPPGAVRDTVFCSALTTGVIDAASALNACP
jgi:subtilase family serine protease